MSSETQGPGPVAAPQHDAGEAYREEGEPLGWPELAGLLKRHQVTLGALAIIAAQLVWKARFLRGFYFRQDDFHFTELALQYGLSWKYLGYVGSGHLHPGVLLLVWVLAKAAPYDWGAATAMTLVLVTMAGLACWWMLRTLIGDRAAILIPLTLYVATPLTLPDDSWWTSAIESLPLQIATMLAVTAHVHYVRTGRRRHAVAEVFWLGVGLFFFEKAVVIPAVLFALTAGFLVQGGIAESVRRTLVRYWQLWAAYAVLVGAYLILLLHALKQSTVKPSPASVSASLAFSWSLVRQTLLPGLFGGPWNWQESLNAAVAYAHPPGALIWLAGIVALVLVVVTVATRPSAWRGWAVLATWVVLADITPILLGRLATNGFQYILGLDTRYVADAAPVAAISVAVVFWPVVRSAPTAAGEAAASLRPRELFSGASWRFVGVCLTAVLVVGSLWSVNRYEQVTAFYDYIGNVWLDHARDALASQPPGTVIVDRPMPALVQWNIYYGTYANESVALAPMESPVTRRDVRWATQFSGTIDRLMMFTPSDGRLVQAAVAGLTARPAGGLPCAPVVKSVITLAFPSPTPTFTGILRVGYLAGPTVAGKLVTVSYGHAKFALRPERGLHAAYFSVTGAASQITITLPVRTGFCLGDAEAGNLSPGL